MVVVEFVRSRVSLGVVSLAAKLLLCLVVVIAVLAVCCLVELHIDATSWQTWFLN